MGLRGETRYLLGTEGGKLVTYEKYWHFKDVVSRSGQGLPGDLRNPELARIQFGHVSVDYCVAGVSSWTQPVC